MSVVISQQAECDELTASLVDEFAEDKVTTVVVAGGARENCNADNGESTQRPSEGSLVEYRQNLVSESVDQETKNVVSDVNQKLMPALGLIGLVVIVRSILFNSERYYIRGSSEKCSQGPAGYQASHRWPPGQPSRSSSPIR